MTDSAVEGPRTTDDVDTIIEISTLLQYQAFESELRNLGFKNDMRDDAPVCRYVHDTLTLDVMPTEPAQARVPIVLASLRRLGVVNACKSDGD